MNPLLKKLNFKDQKQILVLHAPEELKDNLAEISQEVQVDRNESLGNHYAFILVFVNSAKEIIRFSAKLEEITSPSAVLWFAYPKKSSKKYMTDISRDSGWKPLGDLGYESVRQVAIDEDWSALRFRKADEIKNMQRSSFMTISKEGKSRTSKNEKT
jgi:hypothetical protein